ncbi:MAG: DUF3108 domain-containing protein [Atribacterota bacterium]
MKLLIKIFLILLAVTAYPEGLDASGGSKPNWKVGEKLKFSIRWGIITCGYARMEVVEKVRLRDRKTYRIVVTARSAPFFDPFYKVRDRIESYMDAEELHSIRYYKKLREGSYRNEVTIIYDHKYKVAYQNNEKFEITKGIQDVLSSMYYLRTKDLEVGKKYEFDVGTGKKTWPLEVEVVGKEEIKVPAGKFNTYVVIPKLREEGIFKQKGTLKVWLTDNEKKMPVKMKSKIEIGSISAVLLDYKY